MSKPIANIRIDGDVRVIEAAKILLEHALGDLIHLSAPRESTREKYRGSALCRGTLRIPTEESEIDKLERQLAGVQAAVTSFQAHFGQTIRLEGSEQ